MASKRILVTGAGGSIGSVVIGHLLQTTDWEIVALDSFHHKGYKDRLTQVLAERTDWSTRVIQFEHDLTCPINRDLISQIGRIDYILHLAALSDVFLSVENPVWVVQNNVNSTLMMLEYALEARPEQFIYFSTDEVYGPVEKGKAHKEWDTHRPSNAYAASKAAAEDICYAYWRSYGVPLIVTNTMNNFGFRQSASKFPVIVQKKLAKGETITIHGNDKEIGSRFYIDSRDVGAALIEIISRGARLHAIGEIDEPHRYHIVGEKAYTNLELAQTIATIMGKELIYEMQDFHADNPGHDIHYGLENNNLAKWHPHNVEERLRGVIEFQERNPEWL